MVENETENSEQPNAVGPNMRQMREVAGAVAGAGLEVGLGLQQFLEPVIIPALQALPNNTVTQTLAITNLSLSNPATREVIRNQLHRVVAHAVAETFPDRPPTGLPPAPKPSGRDR